MHTNSSYNLFQITVLAFSMLLPASLLAKENVCVPIAGNHVRLRSGSGLQYPVLKQSFSGEGYEVLERSQSETINGFTDYWYRIQDSESKEFWIFGAYLATPEKFKPLKRSRPSVTFCIGDYCPTFRFHNNGTATRTIPMCLGGDCSQAENIAECKHDKGTFIASDPDSQGVDSCTTQVPASIYRNIVKTPELFIIDRETNGLCIMLRQGPCSCVNDQ